MMETGKRMRSTEEGQIEMVLVILLQCQELKTILEKEGGGERRVVLLSPLPQFHHPRHHQMQLKSGKTVLKKKGEFALNKRVP